jgi:hypothetical protein
MSRRTSMKKLIGLLVICSMLTLLLPSKQAEAHGGVGWFLPGLIIGGAIGLGLAPRYYYPPRYYYYPPPAYYPPPPANYYYPPPVYNSPPPEPNNNPGEAGQVPPSGGQLFIYPRQGQSQEKLEKDRQDCHNWALGQTGYDPTKAPPSDMFPVQISQKSDDYQRALGACLDARGYTVR